MRKIFSLAMANIRKSKSQSISFLVIAFISALLLNLGLSTLIDYTKSFDQKSDLLNAPDVIFCAQNQESSFISSFEQLLKEDSRILETETRPAIIAGGEFNYTAGTNTRKTAFFDRSSIPAIGKFTMVDEIQNIPAHAIYLPYLFHVGGGYQIGDEFKITLFSAAANKTEFTYTVAGFYEDIYFSTLNSTITGFLLNHDEYTILDKSFQSQASGVVFSIKTKNIADNERIVTEYEAKLTERCPYGVLTDSNFYQTLKSARTVTSSIGASIIIGFSCMILLVSLIVVNFRIRNSVEEEIRNIGALKAIGYTNAQLINAFLLQFIMLSFIGIVLGTVGSYFTLPALAVMFAAQTGIVWDQQLSWTAIMLTFLFVELLISAVSFLSAIRIRKLTPIVALRTGIQTHSFRRNPFPLSKTRGPLAFTMACKHLARNIKQNILIGIIIVGVTFAAVFAGVLYYNINIESDVFIRMVGGENPHAQLEAVDSESAQRLLEHVKSMKQTEKAMYFSTNSVNVDGDYQANAYIIDDYELVENEDWLYKGRYPRYDNEIAIGGLLAAALNKNIGDTVRLSKGDIEGEYLITGFIQGSNYMGRDLCIREAGFRRISDTFFQNTIGVYLQDKTKTSEFIAQLEQETDDVMDAINTDEIIRSSMSTYQGIVAILAVVISIITIVIIGLVLFLLIKTTLIRKKQELGIQKAIGFTTMQLTLQNALSFLPVIFIGALLGCIAGYYGLNPFLSVLFSGIGIMKVSFILNLPLIAGIFTVIVLFGFAVSILVSCKIKKITPYALMSE